MSEEELIESNFENLIEQLSQWLIRSKLIYRFIRKKSYTFVETELLAKIFNCTLVKFKTKYKLIQNNKILFTGNLKEVFDL